MKRLREKFKRLFGTFEDRASPVPPNAAPAATKIESNVRSTNIEPKAVLCPKEKQENRDSRLESLPPEIRRQLLSILDLPRLKVLVHASPTFHEQYLIDRKYFLCRSIERTLGSATLDAYAVYLSAGQVGVTKQKTAWVPNLYIEQSKQRYLPLTNKLTQEEAISISIFYFCYVNPIMEYFAHWLLRNLAEIGKDPCSHYEKLFCQAVDCLEESSRPERDDILRSFLDVFEPWEIEEIFSSYQFVQDVYDGSFNEIGPDLHPDNLRFEDHHRPPTPTGAFYLENPMERSNYLEGTALRGLSLLFTVLFRIRDHEHLVSIMQQQITISPHISLDPSTGILGSTQQRLRRSNRLSKRDRMEEQRLAFPFLGDIDEPDAPPLSWTVVWCDTYSNLYGDYIPDEMRRWGYVFWDAAIIASTGGRRILEEQWEESSGGYDACDPRDGQVYY